MYCIGELCNDCKTFTRGNDDGEVLKFKDFQGPLTSNSKTFKALFHFQGLSRPWKNGIIFSRTFNNFQGRVATVYGAYSSSALVGLVTLTFDLLVFKWITGHHAWVSFPPIFSLLRNSIFNLGPGTGQADGHTGGQTTAINA